MAAAVPSTGASLLVIPKPSLSSSTSLPLLLSTRPPPLPPPPPVLRYHSPASPGSSLFTPVRCCLNRSADESVPHKFRGKPGFDDAGWVVFMDKPGEEGATEEEMVDFYIQTLAQVVGSEGEAVEKIYRVLSGEALGFGCVIDDQGTVRKLEGLPGVVRVRPDLYIPEYNDPADTLKHFSLNIIRFFRQRELCFEEDGGSAPKWYYHVSDMEMERVKDNIDALSAGFKALDSGQVFSMMLSRVEKVLSELSVNVKQSCCINSATEEEAGKEIEKEKEKEKAMAMEQVKKAMESLSLAKEAVDSVHSDKSDMIRLMAQTLKHLSEQVMKLGDLNTQEADAIHDESGEEAPDEDQVAYAITFKDEETGIPVFVGIASDMAKHITEDKLERMLLNMKKFTKYRENYKKKDPSGNNPICSLDIETWFMDPGDFQAWLEKYFT